MVHSDFIMLDKAFFSGILNQKSNNNQRIFTFVYNCGSESAKDFLKREMDDYKLLLSNIKGKKHLNLLVISHLHDDHINGLKSLLQDFDIDNVVMPYVNDGLKLLASLESSGTDEFLQSFYADPVAWFISRGVRKIFLLGAEEINQDINGTKSFDIEDAELYVRRSYILNLENYETTTVAY